MLVIHSDEDKANQWRMLVKYEDGASEECYSCKEIVDGGCIRYGKFRWHVLCLCCSKCNRSLEIDYDKATLIDQDVWCASCLEINQKQASDTRFRMVLDLDQYSFLLRVSLRKLYSIFGAEQIQVQFNYIDDVANSSSSTNFEKRKDDIDELNQALDNCFSQNTELEAQSKERNTVTSIRNLSLLVRTSKTKGRNKSNKEIPEETTLDGNKKNFISELSILEYFIIKHLAIISLATLMKEYFSFDDLLELIGPQKSNLWSRFKTSLKQSGKKDDGIFKINLSILTEKTGVEIKLINDVVVIVPRFFVDLSEAIKSRNCNVEGVFRKNGNIRRLKETVTLIDDDYPAFKIQDENIVQLAVLVKRFFRDLPTPLFTHKLFTLFICTQSNALLLIFIELESEDDRKTALHLASCLLPREHRHLLESLMDLLTWVARYQEENKMDLNNLATVMAPNILYSKDSVKDDSFLAIKIPELVSRILEDVDLLSESHILSTEDILKRCESFVQLKKANSIRKN